MANTIFLFLFAVLIIQTCALPSPKDGCTKPDSTVSPSDGLQQASLCDPWQSAFLQTNTTSTTSTTRMVTAHDDPRDASAETKITFPETWYIDSPDGLNAVALFLSGLIMVTRNRYLAWPNLLFTINSIINQHPLRTKGESQNATTSRMISLSALVASYLPLIMVQPGSTATQMPLPIPGQ